MKASDIKIVNELLKSLEEKTSKLEMLKGLLTTNKFGSPHKVEIRIGGDCHGNGAYKSVTANLQQISYVVNIISKEHSDVWNEIVFIRAELRDLGVEV